jgi:hypothetical protein
VFADDLGLDEGRTNMLAGLMLLILIMAAATRVMPHGTAARDGDTAIGLFPAAQ